MTDSEDRAVVERLKRLSQIEPGKESTRLALEHAHAALTNLPAATPGRPLEPARPWTHLKHWLGGFTMRRRIAALGGVAVAALLGFVLLWGGIATRPVSAMEKMAENIRKAKSYKYNCLVRRTRDFPERGEPAVTERKAIVYWIAPGSSRTEYIDSPTGTRIDGVEIRPFHQAGSYINHSDKTFYRLPALRRADYSSKFDDIEVISKFFGEADRDLGTKEINGKKARGFQIEMQKMEPDCPVRGLVEIWLDTETNLPVLVRSESKRLGVTTIVEDRDIQWNINLDPKLLDATVPEGYADVTPKPLSLAEQLGRITEALTIYAEACGEHYPRVKIIDLRVNEELCKTLGFAAWPRGKKEGNAGKLRRASEGFDQVAHIQAYSPDCAYYGKTVTPKDKDKVLLRWKLDDGRYEIIYGDLRSETVTAERLRALEGK